MDSEQISYSPAQIAEAAAIDTFVVIAQQLEATAVYVRGVAQYRAHLGRLSGAETPLTPIAQETKAKIDAAFRQIDDILLEVIQVSVEIDAESASAVEEL